MTHCEICLATKFSPTHSILQKCLNCGHIFALVDLDEEGVKSLYQKSYFNGDEYVNYENEVDRQFLDDLANNTPNAEQFKKKDLE